MPYFAQVIIVRYVLMALVALFGACAPFQNAVQSSIREYGFNLTVDNTRCPGTFRTIVVYNNNQLLGQVAGTRVFRVPAGSQDFKATPIAGDSAPITKTIRMEKDEVWKVCE